MISDEVPPSAEITVKHHKEKISFNNDIYFFEKETINLLNKNYQNFLTHKECLIIDGYIIILTKYEFETIFEIGKLNKEGIFNIEIIIKFTNDFEEEKKRLEKLGINKYINCS
jgi:hypothetical protein